MPLLALKHIVFVTGFGWTHVRPNLHFCIRLAAKFPNIFISVYTPGTYVSQVGEYLAEHHEFAFKRVLVIYAAIEMPVKNRLDLLFGMERGFGPWIAGQIARSNSEANGLLVETPCYIIEDFINGGISVTNKQFHGLPVAGWYSATAAAFLGLFGSAKYGDGRRLFGAVHAAVERQELGTSKSFEEILSQELIPDRVICAPGLAPHYEHEQIPQAQPGILPMITHMHKRWISTLEHINAMVFTSVYEMEPIAVETSTKGLSRPIQSFCVGWAADLPLPPPFGLDINASDPVILFMNRAYTDLGPYSVVYISFGSQFFPARESIPHLKILIEEILAQNLRLVISLKAENAKAVGLDGEYTNNLVKNGQAIFPEWAKQLEVLEHPAMHYFVSHGGWNSTTEAILRGVPMIFWPMAADQPSITMQMTRQLDCGFELMQVRTGVARSVAYSFSGDIPITGSNDAVRKEAQHVLKMTKGKRGMQQRLNIGALGKTAVASFEAGGSADVAVGKFGKFMGL